MNKKRLQVPMTDETRLLLERYVQATGQSLPRVCAEILEQTAPVMSELADSIKLAKQAPARAMRGVTETLDQKLAELDQLKMDLSPKATGKKKTG